MTVVNRVAQRVRQAASKFSKGHLARVPGMEPVYQRLFERDMARLGVADVFYPVGSAANYGLMYLLARTVLELGPASVLELGGGQTTLFWNACRAAGNGPASVVTVEHDGDWQRLLSSRVCHEVRHVPLAQGRDGGVSFEGYAPVPLLAAVPSSVDLLVVDGPVAWRPEIAHSRLGCLPLLDRLDPAGAAVVVDDAERPGEVALCGRIDALLRRKGIAFRRGSVTASKRQETFAWGRMETLAFF